MRRTRAAQAGIVLTIAGTMALTGCGGDGKKDGGKSGANSGTTVSPTLTPPASPESASPQPTETPGIPAQGENGVASKPPREIIQSAQGALSSANSVRVSGSFTDPSGRVTIDMRFGQNQSRGTLSAPTKTGRIVTVELRSVGGKFYARAGREFWANQPNAAGAADNLANRWIVAPPSALGAGHNFSGIGSFSTLLGVDNLKGTTKVTGPAAVNGVPAVGVDSGNGVAYVATTGKPYPLRLAAPQRGASERLDFTEYDAPFSVAAPPEAIDFSKVRPA